MIVGLILVPVALIKSKSTKPVNSTPEKLNVYELKHYMLIVKRC